MTNHVFPQTSQHDQFLGIAAAFADADEVANSVGNHMSRRGGPARSSSS
ncbi:hypothetical protein SAMN05446935_7918 [Burkholderia sp. YR290]|nr:hypothetical protein SAMN05446935_7918 [Burkholderia sp. YR290]